MAHIGRFGVPCDTCLSGTKAPVPLPGYVLYLPESSPVNATGFVLSCHKYEACLGGAASRCATGFPPNRGLFSPTPNFHECRNWLCPIRDVFAMLTNYAEFICEVLL